MCIFLCSLSNCKKDPDPTPQLPPETQQGKNTFGCLVNGKVWLPKGAGLVWGIQSQYYTGIISIFTTNVELIPRPYIQLQFARVYKDTAFTIKNYTNEKDFQRFYYSEENTYYYPVNGYTGQFHLKKLDTINHIMAGTFWFDAIDTLSGDTVQIRQGRFDVTFL